MHPHIFSSDDLYRSPEIQAMFNEVDKYFEFKRMKAFLDPFPFLARLSEQFDLQKILEAPSSGIS